MPLSSRGVHKVTSLTLYDVESDALPCLVPLIYLIALYLSFAYPLFREKRIFYRPCKKAVTWENITTHHECPCRIEISNPRGRNFNQGRGLANPAINSDPEGEISLFYKGRLMLDCFSPTFPRFFLPEYKKSKIRENLNFSLVGLTIFLSS